ncbi:MAG: erythromycin esterase family protein, partial [Saprospiraceae bacterium]|nr:erythromycin esterase family protein [Saprospiraceae bacterium]
MKKILLLPFLILFMSISNAQVAKLQPGAVIKKELRKGEKHVYQIDLVQGEYFECVVNQEGVDVVIEVIDASHQIQGTFDSPNEKSGPEPVSVNGTLTGNYRLVIYPLPIDENWPDSLKAVWADENQGKYQIVDIIKLSAEDYQQKMALVAAEEQKFTDWIYQNAHQIKSVVATSESDDLEHFKKILNNVRVVGLGEATHGTSEFFTMKHRMLKFLAEEMNFRSFYIEASMARCRYINDYVLHGSGNLDTATSIQGFVTWRVDEFRNMIEWIRQYNTSVPDDVKIKFMGYDLQVNDRSWSELIDFYHQVDVAQVTKLDSLRMQLDSASALINKEDGWQDGVKLYKKLRSPCHDILVDMSLNRGKYEYRSTKESYQQNLQNVRLIVQELESYLTGYSRDFYMAENILDLLNQEKPGARVVVWAHNFHI